MNWGIHEELADTKLLQEISTQLIRQENIEALYGKIIDAALHIMDAQFASMQQFHPDHGPHGALYLLAFRGFSPEAATHWKWVDMHCTGTACGTALRTRSRVIIPDIETCGFVAETQDRQVFRQTGIAACQTTPLISRSGTLIGMLSTHWRQPYQPSEPQLRLFDILVRQAADLIERRQTEEILRRKQAESERQRNLYEAILSNTPDFAYVFDLSHRFAYANEKLLSIWGRTWEEAIGKNCLELGYEPWHAAMHDREIEQVIATRQPIRGEVPYAGTQGRRIYEYIFAPVLGPDGKVEAIAGTTRDVTDRKQAEEALRYHSKQFETLFNAAPIGVYLVDSDLRICEVNPIARQAFGDIPDGIIGRDIREIMYILWNEEHARKVIDIFHHTLQTGETYTQPECVEFRIDRKMTEYYAWQLNRITLPDGRYGVVSYVRDISQQVHAREALKIAVEKAEQANQAKTDFLANMSHEIRTPMNAVVGLSDILQRPGIPADKQREMLETLRASAGQLMELINDMLDISKLESQNVVLEHIPFSIEDVVFDVASISDVRAKEKGIHIQTEVKCLPEKNVVGDPLRLKQVLLNLLSNAVKFTADGQVTMRVSYLYRYDDVADVQFEVIDTGTGIPADKLDTIFSKFSQADSSITRQYGGTGLGLSITKNLLDLMGGSISVQSEVGKGSRFCVTIPFPVATQQANTIVPSHQCYIPAAATPEMPGRKILLVEDNKANILVATSALEAFGYSYEVAKSGEEALKKMEQRDFDVVLMDIQMPRMDGYQTTRLIREDEARTGKRRIPIIGVTAHAMEKDRERCLQVGMDGYITKPFEAWELQEVITKMAA